MGEVIRESSLATKFLVGRRVVGPIIMCEVSPCRRESLEIGESMRSRKEKVSIICK
jgi:hypothetical protein